MTFQQQTLGLLPLLITETAAALFYVLSKL